MTLEFSLRRRAARSRWLAGIWITLAIAILAGTYMSLPLLTGRLVASVSQAEAASDGSGASPTGRMTGLPKVVIPVHLFALIIIGLGLVVISIACYLLGRSALIEIDAATRFGGLADALCLAGNDLADFERAAAILVPKKTLLGGTKSTAFADLKSLSDVLKTLK